MNYVAGSPIAHDTVLPAKHPLALTDVSGQAQKSAKPGEDLRRVADASKWVRREYTSTLLLSELETKMSSNGGKNEGHLDLPVMPRKLQDEFVYMIQSFLNNVIKQVNDLNKYAEDLCGGVIKEIDRASLRLKTLQDSIIKLTDCINYKLNKGVYLQARESKLFQNTTIQTQRMYFPKQLPAKICETHDAYAQTSTFIMSSPYYQDNVERLKISSDVLHSFDVSKNKITPNSGEQKGRKSKQKKNHLDCHSDLENVPQSQLIENVSLGHIPVVYGKTSNIYVDKSVESPVSTVSLSKMSKFLTSVGKELPNHVQQRMYAVGNVKIPRTYVNYGTGMGEELKPQPRTRLKTEVFVSPTAPNSPPPLPPNWVTLVRMSERTNNSSTTHSATELTSTVLKNSSAVTPDCWKTTLDSGLPVKPPQVEFSSKLSKLFQHHELLADDRLSQSEDQGMPPFSSPFPVSSPRIQSRISAIDGTGNTLVVQSPSSAVCQSVISSFGKSPRPFAKNLPRSPVLSKLRPELASLPSHLAPLTSKSSIALLPTTSSPQTLHSSVPQITVSSMSSSRCSDAKSSNISTAQVSRCLDIQSSRSSVAQLSRSSVTQTGHLIKPQLIAPSLNPTKCSTQQPLFSSSRAFSVSQPSAQFCSGLKQFSPSTLPVVTNANARSALMESIRKGVLLRKTKDQCASNVKMENSKNEANSILTRRKAMGYNSGKSDSEVDWMEEK
ncbi:actin-binding protein WASF1-like [Erinaceus europaeus]|uniref:Actin-binding protein WASF1-like n=1 Tax=Erinaceus europaeus TaxID=9365 RepID=A0ABM3WS52_ERIEU|nr:actin-binding protein WASF1-like [Erinaceus europaeus]